MFLFLNTSKIIFYVMEMNGRGTMVANYGIQHLQYKLLCQLNFMENLVLLSKKLMTILKNHRFDLCDS